MPSPSTPTLTIFDLGADWSKDRVDKYNSEKLFAYGFIHPKGSVFSYWMILRSIVMCAVGTFVALPSFRCGTPPQNFSFCFPVLSISEGLLFAGLVAFLLGVSNSITFSRWWSMRERLGVIMNNTAYETMLLSNFVVHEEAAQTSAKTIIRWLNLAHCLVYKQATKSDDFSDLLDTKLATPDEIEKLQTYSNLPVMVYGWCMQAIKDLISQNKVAPTVASSTISCIASCFTATQELLAFIETQLPYAYLHMLAVITKIHLTFVVFYGGGMISDGIFNGLWTRILLGYVTIIANNVIYEGLLHIHSTLSNPLENASNDFPNQSYISSTLALCNSLQAI